MTAALPLLLGPQAPALMQTVLDDHDARLRALRATTVNVRPDGSATVQYLADIDRDERTLRDVLAATTGGRIPPGAAVLAGDVDGAEVRVGLWRWPHDPALPALATATDPVRLSDLLRTRVTDVRIRAYRPGRRAVLQVTGDGPPLYCKVVRPSRVGALRTRHDLLAAALPVPPVLTTTDDGLVVLPALPGTPLRTLIDGGGPLPDGPALDALLDRLPPAVADLPRSPAHLERVRHFADVLALTAVTDRARLDALVARLAAVDPGEHPDVPVHGDFYEGQLLADGRMITGLLDVDTAGSGHRIDEWATLLAHLSVLDRASANRYGAALLGHAERRFPREHLRPRIAAAVVGLATGPYRVQQPGWAGHTARRLAQAQQWLG